MAFDFKKEYKEFYLTPVTPPIVEVPEANYIAVRGKGGDSATNCPPCPHFKLTPRLLPLESSLHGGMDRQTQSRQEYHHGECVNTWPNRLIGDAEPGAEKVTYTTMAFYRAGMPLTPSGLMGPVVLEKLISIQ